jgi:hypothetical protein
MDSQFMHRAHARNATKAPSKSPPEGETFLVGPLLKVLPFGEDWAIDEVILKTLLNRIETIYN